MVTVVDRVNEDKDIKVGSVVSITNDAVDWNDEIPFKAIVVKLNDNSYGLMDMHTFTVFAIDIQLEILIMHYGLVSYSDNIEITIK